MSNQTGERRRCGRYEVEWPAEVLANGTATAGVMRDLGDCGAFIDVSSAGRRLNGSELARLLEIGDQLFVSYTLRPFTRSVRRLASLRWIGRHPTQHCVGLGVQFELEP